MIIFLAKPLLVLDRVSQTFKKYYLFFLCIGESWTSLSLFSSLEIFFMPKKYLNHRNLQKWGSWRVPTKTSGHERSRVFAAFSTIASVVKFPIQILINKAIQKFLWKPNLLWNLNDLYSRLKNVNIWQNFMRQITIEIFFYWLSDRIYQIKFDQILNFFGREWKSLRFDKRLHFQEIYCIYWLIKLWTTRKQSKKQFFFKSIWI